MSVDVPRAMGYSTADPAPESRESNLPPGHHPATDQPADIAPTGVTIDTFIVTD